MSSCTAYVKETNLESSHVNNAFPAQPGFSGASPATPLRPGAQPVHPFIPVAECEAWWRRLIARFAPQQPLYRGREERRITHSLNPKPINHCFE